ALPHGWEAAKESLAAVLLLDVPLLPGRFRHCRSGNGIEPCRWMAGFASGPAADVSRVYLLPAVSGAGGTRTGPACHQNRSVDSCRRPSLTCQVAYRSTPRAAPQTLRWPAPA